MTINLGNIVGNTVIGISSNLDSSVIVSDLEGIRRQPIVDLEGKIESNLLKTEKFSELKTLLNNFKSANQFLRNDPRDVFNPFSNVFDYRTSSLSSSTLSSVSSYLSVTANPGAVVGSTAIEIGQLAEALEQRSGSFNTRAGDVTTNASGAYFDPGTFQIGSGITQTVTGDTLDSFQLSAGDYSVSGSVSGIVSSLDNFVVNGASGGIVGLQGEFSQFSGSYDGLSGELTVTFVKDGVTYTSNAITADSSINAGANTGITSGTVITFTADSGGDNETSFDITLASDIIIDADSDNVTTFLDDLVTGLDGVSIYQSRQISNFTDANVKSPLSSLTNANIRFISDNFNSTSGEFGLIDEFEVKASTGSDGAISVVIGNETFRAVGLGATLNSNLTLQSTSTNKSLQINIGDAGDSIDISSTSAAVAFEKSLEYAFGTREIVDITIDSGDSLNNIAFAINQQTSETGLAASIIQVDEFDFRLSLKSINEGLEGAYEIFDDSSILTNASISTTNAAQNSLVRVDGIEVERSSNVVTDLIENVTLELIQVTPDYNEITPDSIDLTIDNDIESVVTAVVSFLDSYNAIRVFNAQQNERNLDDSSFTEDAVLGGDNILGTLTDQIASEVSGIVGNASDDDFDALLDIGIIIQDFEGDGETPATNNILSYDENKLREKLTANFDKVRDVFELQVNTSDSSLAVLEAGNNFELYDFQLEIDLAADEGQQVKLLNSDGSDYLDSESNNVYLDYSSGNITGQTGTVLSGVEFVYTGSNNDTISVSIQQGLADRFFNVVDAYTENEGVIDTAVNGIIDQNEGFNVNIRNLERRVESYVESLRAQFIALESAIAGVNSILTFLEANTDARNNS